MFAVLVRSLSWLAVAPLIAALLWCRWRFSAHERLCRLLQRSRSPEMALAVKRLLEVTPELSPRTGQNARQLDTQECMQRITRRSLSEAATANLHRYLSFIADLHVLRHELSRQRMAVSAKVSRRSVIRCFPRAFSLDICTHFAHHGAGRNAPSAPSPAVGLAAANAPLHRTKS